MSCRLQETGEDFKGLKFSDRKFLPLCDWDPSGAYETNELFITCYSPFCADIHFCAIRHR